jgi:endothelin-converting enzyme
VCRWPPRIPEKPKPLPNPFTRKSRLTSALLFLHSRSISALFVIGPSGDVKKNPKLLVPWLGQDGLGLPAIEYYLEEGNDKIQEEYRRAIAAVLKEVYHARGESDWYDLDSLAQAVLTFETKLAAIFAPLEDIYEPSKSYNPISFEDLKKELNIINWGEYIAGFNVRTEFPSVAIIESGKEFPKKLKALVNVQKESLLEAYFVWMTALEVKFSHQPSRSTLTYTNSTQIHCELISLSFVHEFDLFPTVDLHHLFARPFAIFQMFSVV